MVTPFTKSYIRHLIIDQRFNPLLYLIHCYNATGGHLDQPGHKHYKCWQLTCDGDVNMRPLGDVVSLLAAPQCSPARWFMQNFTVFVKPCVASGRSAIHMWYNTVRLWATRKVAQVASGAVLINWLLIPPMAYNTHIVQEHVSLS